MKVIVNGLDLSDATLKVVKAVSSKTTNPVLEGIRFTAKGDTVTLLATDMEIAIEKTIRAEVLQEGETVVPGKYFSEYVKKLEKENQIELYLMESNQLAIRYADSEGLMQVLSSEDFPEINREINENSFTLQQKDFKDLIAKTTFCCSQDESRPILKGCLFEINEDELTAVALDGFRLAVCKKQVSESTGTFKAIVPGRTLSEISRLIEKEEENVTVRLQKNYLAVEVAGAALFSRLYEGDFINYKGIIPSDFVTYVAVSREQLLTAIDRASVVAKNDRNNLIKLEMKEKTMSVLSNSEIGNVNETVFIDLEGKDLVIAFNGRYLADALRAVSDDHVYFYFNTAIAPCVIKPRVGEDYLYLILPVRISA